MSGDMPYTAAQLDAEDAALAEWEAACSKLMALGAVSHRNRQGENRLDRAEHCRVLTVGELGDTVAAKVQGGRVYNVHITVAPYRSYHCNCRDSTKRGRQVGPCKHTLALVEHLQEDTIEARARYLADARYELETAAKPLPLPKPGTHAFTARLMAGPSLSPEEAEFWDNWKEEQKMRNY